MASFITSKTGVVNNNCGIIIINVISYVEAIYFIIFELEIYWDSTTILYLFNKKLRYLVCINMYQ